MRKSYNYISFIFFLFLNQFPIQAQDINFSQFYELAMLRNPALAGFFKGDIKMTANYRNQWQSIGVPFQTSAISFETRTSVSQSSFDYLSLGIQLTNDIAGDSKLGKTQFLPFVTYHKLLVGSTNTYLSLGFMGGAVQQRFNPIDLRFDDQFVNGSYSPLNPTRQNFSRTNFTYGDATVGLSLSSEVGAAKAYVGASYFHFLQPRVAFNREYDIRLNKKFVMNMGLSTPMSDFDNLVLYGDLFFQGGSRQFQGGLMYMHNIVSYGEEDDLGIGVGAFYRWDDAIIPLVKLNWYQLSFGFTYDVNISKLKPASLYRGGLEASVSYKAYLNIMNSSLQKVKCVVPF